MTKIKKEISKIINNRARKIFPEPSEVILRNQDFLTIACGIITKANWNSFANIENYMRKLPILDTVDFRFQQSNPNINYRLARGLYDTNIIEARLITDGFKKRTRLESTGTNEILNPLNPERTIRLTSSTLEEIELEKATFAIEEYLVGGRTEFIRFISQITDRDELKKIANFINKERSNNRVQVLSLKK